MNWKKITKQKEKDWDSEFPIGLFIKDSTQNIYLVGDLNINKGMCDCCSIKHEQIIEYCDDFLKQINNIKSELQSNVSV